MCPTKQYQYCSLFLLIIKMQEIRHSNYSVFSIILSLTSRSRLSAIRMKSQIHNSEFRLGVVGVGACAVTISELSD
jgi:hypothetical protein